MKYLTHCGGKALDKPDAGLDGKHIDDTYGYGSFTCAEPTKLDHDIQMKQPKKILVQEKNNDKS